MANLKSIEDTFGAAVKEATPLRASTPQAAGRTAAPVGLSDGTKARALTDGESEVDEDKLAESARDQSKIWACSPDGTLFWSSTPTSKTLPAGLYKCIYTDSTGHTLKKLIVSTDDLIVLDDDAATTQVMKEIEKFWTRALAYKKMGLLHKRGMLLYGDPGCHARDTEILMFDGSLKKVQDIKINDLLMGPDSKSRKVLELCRGRDKMYRVNPIKGDSFMVNQHHVLSLCSTSKPLKKGTTINMKVMDFIKQSGPFRERMKLYRSEVEFSTADKLPMPAYILGAWLGDGSSGRAALTTMDSPIRNAWSTWLTQIGCEVSTDNWNSGLADTITGTMKISRKGLGRGTKTNPGTRILSQLGVLDNKHIPQQFLTASREDRLDLLAGLLDTDGHLGTGGFDFISKSQVLAKQTVFLARSLGLSAYVKTTEKGCTYLGKKSIGTYWRVSISGNTEVVPCRLERKRATDRRQIKNHLVTGFTLEEAGEDDFFGFTLTGDHLYLMGDFTVTHNSGKTASLQMLIALLNQRNGVAIYADDPNLLTGSLQILRRIEPERPTIVILEDFETLTERSQRENEWLSVLDGEAQIDNVVFLATTNYVEKLDKRFTDRPSRFDTVMKVPMPSAKTRAVYLMAKVPFLSNGDIQALVSQTKGMSIAHLKEVIVAVFCLNDGETLPVEERDSLIVSTIARLRKMQERNFSSNDTKPDYDGAAGHIGFGNRNGTADDGSDLNYDEARRLAEDHVNRLSKITEKKTPSIMAPDVAPPDVEPEQSPADEVG